MANMPAIRRFSLESGRNYSPLTGCMLTQKDKRSIQGGLFIEQGSFPDLFDTAQSNLQTTPGMSEVPTVMTVHKAPRWPSQSQGLGNWESMSGVARAKSQTG
jgi:hypothetical protein